MKQFLLVIFLCTTCFVPVKGQQGTVTELETLQKQLPDLLNAGKLDEAIRVSENIVKIEKRLRGSSDNYYTALHTLALLKKRRLLLGFKGKLSTPAKFGDEVRETQELFRDLLELSKNSKIPKQMALAYSELAEFLSRYNHSAPEIEDYYIQSISLLDQLNERDPSSTHAVLTSLSEYYVIHCDLEKFLPVQLRLIGSLEKSFGTTGRNLLPHLKRYADFLATVDRMPEAAAITKRIAEIEGMDYTPVSGRNILGRAISQIDRVFGKSSESLGIFSGVGANSAAAKDKSGLFVVASPGALGREIERDFAGRKLDIELLIDESGNVIKVEPPPNTIVDKELMDKISNRARTWKFKPYIYEGVSRKMHAIIHVRYFD